MRSMCRDEFGGDDGVDGDERLEGWRGTCAS